MLEQASSPEKKKCKIGDQIMFGQKEEKTKDDDFVWKGTKSKILDQVMLGQVAGGGNWAKKH